jgi:small-conductance mechanosensitive channel
MTPELWIEWSLALDSWRIVRGVVGALTMALSAGALVLLSTRLDPLRHRLRPNGLLPRTLDVLRTVLRTAAGVVALLAVLAVVPTVLLPAVGVIGLGAAFAVGWTPRSWLPGLLAAPWLVLDGRLRAGERVWWRGDEGVVRWVGLRATRIATRDGTEHVVPNDALVRDGFVHDPARWPEVPVELRLPDLPPAQVEAAIREAALLSPWRAPGAPYRVDVPASATTPWVVHTHIVAWEHADAHAQAIRSLVRRALDL